ncbi:MAG: VWA domain-containing protein [Deltaproteobacteria bacterium]|nr:VWA domain-containing protein [Deltaproteobacteria bacterium]
MTKSRRRSIEIFSLSFLDAISCGFGAIILLLIIALASEPKTIQRVLVDLSDRIAEIEGEREKVVAEGQGLSRKLADKNRRLLEIQQRLAVLSGQWTAAKVRSAEAKSQVTEQAKIEKALETVRQTLSEEMKRLIAQPSYKPPKKDTTIGGIPVDSEYIIFIVDTSGSMLRGAWPLVVKKVEEVLAVHPKVKGIQVLNDMGEYMYGAYAGRWIPDTPARRRAVISRFKHWQSFSNSSPVEGVLFAVRKFFSKDKRISLYVFGDDFSSGSTDAVLREIAVINQKDASGRPRVRIHTFGFPVLFESDFATVNRTRFAHLMRLLAEQNAGSFVGLPGLH